MLVVTSFKPCVYLYFDCLHLKVTPRWHCLPLTLQFPTHMANEVWTKNEPTGRQRKSRNLPLSKAKKLPLKVLLTCSLAYLLRTSYSPHAIYYFHIFTQLLLHCHPSFLVQPCLFPLTIYSVTTPSTTSLHHLLNHTLVKLLLTFKSNFLKTMTKTF